MHADRSASDAECYSLFRRWRTISPALHGTGTRAKSSAEKHRQEFL
jgi:hypothetical protein